MFFFCLWHYFVLGERGTCAPKAHRLEPQLILPTANSTSAQRNLSESRIQAQRQYQLAWICNTITAPLKSVIRILRDVS